MHNISLTYNLRFRGSRKLVETILVAIDYHRVVLHFDILDFNMIFYRINGRMLGQKRNHRWFLDVFGGVHSGFDMASLHPRLDPRVKITVALLIFLFPGETAYLQVRCSFYQRG